MGWIFLIIAIILESVAIICMKFSEGFQQQAWAIAATISYLLSLVFLTIVLKQLPAGLANATWAGASTIPVAFLCIFIFKEQSGVLQIVFLSLIVIGHIGLNPSKPG